LEDEKKSIKRPIVKGILIDTEADINNSPTAINNGFFSGFAKDTILVKDESPCGLFAKILARMDERGLSDSWPEAFSATATLLCTTPVLLLLTVLLNRSCLPFEISLCCRIRKFKVVEDAGCDRGEVIGVPPFHGGDVTRVRVRGGARRTCTHRLNGDAIRGPSTTFLRANTLSIVSGDEKS